MVKKHKNHRASLLKCVICNHTIATEGRRKYCCDVCAKEGQRRCMQEYERLRRPKRDKREYLKKYYRANKERLLAQQKAYSKTPAGRRARRISHKNQREKNPTVYFARQEVYKALRRGDLVKEPCTFCGEEKTGAHHPDYSKPLDVIWVCDRCHKKVIGEVGVFIEDGAVKN